MITARTSTVSYRISDAPAVKIEPKGACWSVRIEGRFPVDCMGRLATGVAEAGTSIVSGRALRLDRQRWVIELAVEPARPGARPDAIDYALLASRAGVSAPADAVALEACTVARDVMRRALVVEIRGRDQVGFLADLLGKLAGLLLFPVELTLATSAGVAADRLVLRALRDKTPSPEAEEMLRALLERLTVGNA